MIVKRCPTCDQDRPLTKFSSNPFNADGLTRSCNDCRGTSEPVDKHVYLSLTIDYKQWDFSGMSLERDTLYVARKVVENFSKLNDPEYLHLIRRFAELILTVVNEDGTMKEQPNTP